MRRLLCTVVLAWIVCGAWTVSEAAIRYVSNSGSNGNSCAQSTNILTPKQTLSGSTGALRCITAAGDVLNIRGGTYNENVDDANDTFASGTGSGSTYTNPVTIQAYNNEPVIINGFVNWANTPLSYIIMQGPNLILDHGGAGVAGDRMISFGYTGQQTHIRFQDMEIRNHGGVCIGAALCTSGCGGTNTVTSFEFKRITCHDMGSYGTYLETDNNLVEDSVFYNLKGYGIHNYSSDAAPSNNIYRRNIIHDWGSSYAGASGGCTYGAILLRSGNNNLAYNNLVYNGSVVPCVNAAGNTYPEGLISTDGTGNKFYNNTVYNANQGIQVESGGSGTEFKNNILYNNSAGNVAGPGTGSVTFQTNLCNATGTGCAIGGNPLFVNAGAGNFQLSSTSSPAYNAGTTLAAVPDDFNQVTRPQAGVYDIGAYEFVGSVDTLPPAAPTNLRVVP